MILIFIEGLNDLRPLGLRAIGMTTNGIALHRKLPTFIRNGLTHLNLRYVSGFQPLLLLIAICSLDTLDPFRFEIMTRRRGHELVLKTLDEALHSESLQSVKLNVVVIKGLNDSEIIDFVEMTKHTPLSVRFIEFMPFTGMFSIFVLFRLSVY